MQNNYILDSNHFGIAGFYSMMAAKEGLMVALTIVCFIQFAIWDFFLNEAILISSDKAILL